MTADIELLPLPEHPGGERLGAKWNDGDMYFHARAVAEHNVKERAAEIEALRAIIDNREAIIATHAADTREYQKQLMHAQARAERLAEALREALECGNDGDWQSARQYITAALRDHDQEEGSGAFWGSSPKSGGPDWTGFDG